MFTKLICALGGIALGAAASGCVVHDQPSEPIATPTGTLTTSWTVDGSSSMATCAAYGVDRVRVVIADDTDMVISDEEPFCEEGSVSIDLAVGWYSSEVTLLDAADHEVSDTIITDVRVVTDTEAFVDVDFPSAGIY